MPVTDALTPLERRFILELAKDGNKAAAAERAGCKGTKRTFKRLGFQMLAKESVRKAYDALIAKELDKAMITKDGLINQIQETIMEARVANKFDAAFKGYSQLGEILGVLGNKKKDKDEDGNENKTASQLAFNQGDEDQDLNEDLAKYLDMALNKTKTKVAN